MTKLKSATMVWPARVGAVALVAAAGLTGVASPSYAAAAAGTASPSTGAANGIISITTTTANVFKNAAGVSQVGSVQFSSAACPSTTATVAAPAARAIGDLVSYLPTTLTSATAAFTAGDLGATIAGTGIPSGTTIAAVNSATRVTLSAAATIEGTNVSITVAGGGSPRATDAVTHDGKTISSATAAFVVGDAGKAVTGTGIPASATIASRTSATVAVLSAPVTVASSGAGGLAIGTAGGPYAAAAVTPVSGTKLVVKAPPAVTTVAAGSSYNICVYNAAVGSSGSVIATATYKVYAAPTITAISPASGPALGGTLITIAGTGFSATTKATVDGATLANLKVDTTAGVISGNVPSHAPGPVDVVVTSEGGPTTLAGGYTYMDGISITAPTTMTATGSAVLDIYGAGFTSSTLSFADFSAAPDLGAAAFTDSGDLVTIAGHGLANGDRVRFVGIASTTGIVNSMAYFVIGATTNTFQVAATQGGTAIDLVTDGTSTGTLDLARLPLSKVTGATTTTVATDLVNLTAHGLANGDRVVFSGIASTTGISNYTWYYVVSATANTFKVALTRGGSAIDLTGTDGSATGTWISDVNTHVIVARSAYDDAAIPGKAGSIAGECTGVVVVSDTELICTLDGGASGLPAGAYQVVIVDNLLSGPDRTTIVTSPSTYTVAPY